MTKEFIDNQGNTIRIGVDIETPKSGKGFTLILTHKGEEKPYPFPNIDYHPQNVLRRLQDIVEYLLAGDEVPENDTDPVIGALMADGWA